MLILTFLSCYALFTVKALSSTNVRGALSRRDFGLIGGSSIGTGLWLPDRALAADDANSPIAVIGASGRTGIYCVSACLDRGVPVRALTRTGTWTPPAGADGGGGNGGVTTNSQLLTVSACDVRSPTSLAAGVSGCRGAIYAASASKRGGNAKEVDNVGAVAAGDACLSANVGRYVVISSTATTRPGSLGYKFTNAFGGIMDEKRRGEIGVREAYRNAAKGSSSSYTILRPGGLEEPKRNEVLGPASLEISQGDVFAGIVSRADLAEAAVELALCDAPNVRDTALELYYADTAQPCEGRLKALLKNDAVSRLHGDSYQELFRGIQPDVDFFVSL